MSRPVNRTDSGIAAPAHEPGRRPNRLSREKSPYLLQHASNPVDWYPWGDEAFETAQREGKPIFLSIGYSTCHWCHVMERESFEDDEVAEALNRGFVPVKVDREERPDVDRLYMTAMQAMGMGGGWPLSVFLTPDLEPFFGGTYFPPRTVAGRIGMLDLLPRVLDTWNQRGAEVRETGRSVLAALEGLGRALEPTSPGREALLQQAHDTLARSFDREWGGFGSAPKFPQTANLDFLLRGYARDRERNERALDMVVRQLDAMRRGGIHDALGGGFHRYSTDREWLVPHFEKMLYDQGQLATAYLDAYRLTKRPEHAGVARGVLDYVARDLTSPEGAFLSAEDADSEGEEGRFYVWTPDQIAAALPPDQAELLSSHYGVTAGGNFEHGTSILHETRSVDETASRFGLSPEVVASVLSSARARLLEVRSTRVRPYRDDKVIAAWNGLMITAFARGAIVFDDPALLDRARRAGEFVWDRLRDPHTGVLRRRHREGEGAGHGQLDDHGHVALGLIELYRASLDPVWLERAIAMAETLIERFWSAEDGVLYSTPADAPHLKLRLEDDHDGAEVSGVSTALECIVTLAALLDRSDWRELARRAFERYERKLARYPAAMPRMLGAMLLDEVPARHIVVAGTPDASDTRALIRAFNERFLPGDLMLLASDGDSRQRLDRLAPFATTLRPRDGRATAYVCLDYACHLPTTDPAEFASQLDATPR